MSEYTILFIDEEQDWINSIANSLERNDEGIEIRMLAIKPVNNNTKDNILSQIDEEKFDYLIVDYYLNQNVNLDFNGEDLLVAFRENHPTIPAMLLSSDRDRAFGDTSVTDPYHICDKEDVDESFFVNNIKKAIDIHNMQLSDWENELSQLAEKEKSEGLRDKEYSRLIELDSLLEKAIGDQHTSISKDLKQPKNQEYLKGILKETDLLLNEIRKNGT